MRCRPATWSHWLDLVSALALPVLRVRHIKPRPRRTRVPGHRRGRGDGRGASRRGGGVYYWQRQRRVSRWHIIHKHGAIARDTYEYRPRPQQRRCTVDWIREGTLRRHRRVPGCITILPYISCLGHAARQTFEHRLPPPRSHLCRRCGVRRRPRHRSTRRRSHMARRRRPPPYRLGGWADKAELNSRQSVDKQWPARLPGQKAHPFFRRRRVRDTPSHGPHGRLGTHGNVNHGALHRDSHRLTESGR